MKKHNLNGFTLGELLVVLVIIGILTSLLFPNLFGFITKAKSVEAELHLKNVHTCQQYHFNLHSKYSNSLEDIDFVQEKLITEGGKANYKIEIVEASPSSFKARATSVVDFDKDGVFNVWEVDQNLDLKEVVKD